jgi:hypothetical protein
VKLASQSKRWSWQHLNRIVGFDFGRKSGPILDETPVNNSYFCIIRPQLQSCSGGMKLAEVVQESKSACLRPLGKETSLALFRGGE